MGGFGGTAPSAGMIRRGRTNKLMWAFFCGFGVLSGTGGFVIDFGVGRTYKWCMSIAMRQLEEGVVFSVKVGPGSSRSEVKGLFGESLKVLVASAPEKGKANKELVAVLAGVLDRSKSEVKVYSGARSKRKEILVLEMKEAELKEKLADYLE